MLHAKTATHESGRGRKTVMGIIQLAVAPTLQGCKFRGHHLTTPPPSPESVGGIGHAYLHS